MTIGKTTNISQVPQRSIFRYPGGKTWLIPIIRMWLGGRSPKVRLLLEAFTGGGIVGLTATAEGLAKKALLVELDEQVASVWCSVLNGHVDWLCKKIGSFDFTEQNVRKLLSNMPKYQHELAFQTIVHNRASRNGIMATGAGLLKNGENGNGIASRWYPETLQKRIKDIKQMSDKICFIHGDGFTVIEDHLQNKGTALFLDPPYTVVGRKLYRHNDIDHEKLFSLASRHKGPCLMTYDDCEEVRAWVRRYDLHFRRISMQNAHLTKKRELLISRSFEWLR